MEYINYLAIVFMVIFGVMLSVVSVSYYGVVALMGFVFFCCVIMVFMGQVFIALVMFIVYLGGLVVVFGYCVSLEKDFVGLFSNMLWKYVSLVGACFGFIISLLVVSLFGFDGWFVTMWRGSCVDTMVNGFSVFYGDGGVGLIVCLWGLFMTLFSVLIILGWSKSVSFRSF
uniref:NADH-ubiquinone oxidoreductase chain 6 n=1 Tax=Acrochordus granulatus TaxID=46287 RepID=Q402M0_ACRGR|nr:NADH dehydrogenase subunit 6 [Acrochordus granulatus]BAE20025.1 NADH dehydrogenase subunit 6 [Acrochordus granulatus]